MTIRIIHIAGRMPAPFEVIIIDPPADEAIEDHIPSGCEIDLQQELFLEGEWPSMPSETTFDRHWE